jgi:hypothetical protein
MCEARSTTLILPDAAENWQQQQWRVRLRIVDFLPADRAKPARKSDARRDAIHTCTEMSASSEGF